MKPKAYLETTIPSYLAAWPSRDLIIAAHQQITHEWWQIHRADYDLFVSQIVVEEVGLGDSGAATRRLQLLEGIPLVEQSDSATELAKILLYQVPLPEKAAVDVLHIAIAVAGGMDYLITWNCTHIANATLRSRIEAVCRSHGYEPPVICTPEELMEG
jgi:hypothetical protein